MATSVKEKPKQKNSNPPETAVTPGETNVSKRPINEAWGLIHSERGGDLWHATRYEIRGNFAKEIERFPATLKIIAIEHIRDNIHRLRP